MPDIFTSPKEVFLQVYTPPDNQREKVQMPFTLTQAQDNILEALFTLYYADARRLNRLLRLSENSLTRTKNNLTPLMREEYVTVINEEQRKRYPNHPGGLKNASQKATRWITRSLYVIY